VFEGILGVEFNELGGLPYGFLCDQEPDDIVFTYPENYFPPNTHLPYTWYSYQGPWVVVQKAHINKVARWFSLRGRLVDEAACPTQDQKDYLFIDDIVVEAMPGQDWCSHTCFRVAPGTPLVAQELGNVVTANGDGINDHFAVKVSNAVYAELEVYYTQNSSLQKKKTFFVPNGMKDFLIY